MTIIAPSPASTPRDAALPREAERLRRALQALSRVTQCCDRDRACCHGVSASGSHALDALSRIGSVSLNRLAAELFLDKSTTSRIVTSLERDGLVERAPDPDDRRAVLVGITGAGREIRERIREEGSRDAEALLAAHTPEVRAGIVSLLDDVVGRAAQWTDVEGASCCTPAGSMTPLQPLGELAEVRALLASAGLPAAGIEERFPAGYVLQRAPASGDLIAVAGIEVFGEAGLLRSLAVREEMRGSGLGRAIATSALAGAAAGGVRTVFLLTTGAAGFFARLGFEPTDRATVPEAVRASPEFSERRCESAVVMRREL